MPYMPKKKSIQIPPRLTAKGQMRPNDLCWCGSGQKWKRCHRGQELKPSVNYFEVLKKTEEQFLKGYCSHPNAPVGCSEGIIRAHTVQKSGVLDAVSEDRHVISARGKKSNLHKTNGILEPQRVGVNSASTFLGFCNTHDTTMFRDIESGHIEVSEKFSFLLTYRAVSYELFTKRAGREAVKAFKVGADAGKTIGEQEYIQNFLGDMIVGMNHAMIDLEAWKADLDIRYRMQNFSGFKMSATWFDCLLPVVATFTFHPEHDFHGRVLQNLMDKDLEPLTFNLIVQDGKSVLLLTWQEGALAPVEFVKSFESLPGADKATAALSTCLSHSENWHARPSWWVGLTGKQKAAASKYMHFGMPEEGGERPDSALVPSEAPIYLKAQVIGGQRL